MGKLIEINGKLFHRFDFDGIIIDSQWDRSFDGPFVSNRIIKMFYI